jgi:hypothetical protein
MFFFEDFKIYYDMDCWFTTNATPLFTVPRRNSCNDFQQRPRDRLRQKLLHKSENISIKVAMLMFLVIYHEMSLVKCLSSKISKSTMTWTVGLRQTRLHYLQSRDETVAIISNQPGRPRRYCSLVLGTVYDRNFCTKVKILV